MRSEPATPGGCQAGAASAAGLTLPLRPDPQAHPGSLEPPNPPQAMGFYRVGPGGLRPGTRRPGVSRGPSGPAAPESGLTPVDSACTHGPFRLHGALGPCLPAPSSPHAFRGGKRAQPASGHTTGPLCGAVSSPAWTHGGSQIFLRHSDRMQPHLAVGRSHRPCSG